MTNLPMRASDLLKKYRQGINPPYSLNRKDLIAILSTLFILLVLPLTVILVNQAREPKSRADQIPENLVSSVQTSQYYSNELLVKIKSQSRGMFKETGKPQDTGIASINQINRDLNVTKLERVGKIGKNSKRDAEIFGWFKVTLSERGELITGKLEKVTGKLDTDNPASLKLQSLIDRFNQDSNVEVVEPNYVATILVAPNDPYYSTTGSWGQPYPDLWGLKKINSESAWDQTKGSSSLIVADIDTGVDRNHEDLQGQMWTNTGEIPGNGVDDDGNGYKDDYFGWDWVNDDSDPMDDHGHGTHTVGTIAGVGNNAKGVVGVNWTSKIMALKFLSASGSGAIDDGAVALQYAADMGARISSNSWSCGCVSNITNDAVKYEHDRGMVVAAAAGNSNTDALSFSPASADGAITVAASDYNDTKASFSNWGEKIDVAAPGVDVLSLKATVSPMCTDIRTVGIKYCRVSGTSMATPHVAGLAALLLAKNPSLNNEEVRQILRQGADDLGTAGKDNFFGFGRINAAQALNLSGSEPLTPVISSPASRGVILGSSLEIKGSISGSNFANYKLEIGEGRSPTGWTLLSSSSNQVINSTLGTVDTTKWTEGSLHIVRLSATNKDGKIFQSQIYDLNVDNFDASITSPNTVYGNVVDIVGTAQTKNGVSFSNYTLEYGPGSFPTSWSTSGLTLVNGGTSPVVSGNLASWDTSGLQNNTTYTLRLTVKSTDGRTLQGNRSVYVDKDVLPGWPKDIGVMLYDPPAVGDINGDGTEEIIVAPSNASKVSVFAKDGSSLPGWPVSLSGLISSSEPIVTDMNGDGKKEILVNSGGLLNVLSSNGLNLPGWPKSISVTGIFAVGDIDGNGSKEIVVLSLNYLNSSLDINIYNANGALWPGFPKIIYQGAGMMSSSYKNWEISLVDLDKDNKLEIVHKSVNYNIDKVYVLDNQGNLKSGWPVTLSNYEIDRTLAGDITGDGKAEIIVYYSSPAWSGEDAYITVFDLNGNQLPNYPQPSARNVSRMGPALADATGDGLLDIILPNYGEGNTGRFYCSPLVLNKDGQVNTFVSCGASEYGGYHHDNLPAVVDFNNDGQPDVVAISSTTRVIHALERYYENSQLKWRRFWEKKIGGNVNIQPIVSDLDKNGKWEIIAGVDSQSSTSVFVWESGTSNSTSWPQYMKDERRSSTYGSEFSVLPPPSDTTPPTISISSPASGVTISGSVNITANASDNVGVSRVDFRIDGVVVNSDTTSPYTYSWNSTTVSNGLHSIGAYAYDATGNVANVAINVTVQNGDTTPPSIPTGLTASGVSYNRVNLSWTASTDNVGVTGYWIVRNGVTIAQSATNSYADTTVTANTSYTYRVIAYDAAGNNSAASNSASVTTPNAPDTQAPTAPANLTATAVSSSQINLSWTASSDNVGVTGYDVYRNGTRIATVTTTSFGNTGLSANTSYSYYVRAKDASGNVSAASNTVSATTWSAPALDTDSDGFTDAQELYMGTNASKACGNPTLKGLAGIPSNTWPADLWTQNASKDRITIQDVSSYLAPVRRLDSALGDANYHKRYDLDANRIIDITDLNKVNSLMNRSCK